MPDASISLEAAPASLPARFSFGCGSSDGSASCDLGAVDSGSVPRQLQATVTVPGAATSVTSVTLTVIGHAAQLTSPPQASAKIIITTPATLRATATPRPTVTVATTPPLATAAAPLPIGSLPSFPESSPSLSPGGNAAALFPRLTPSQKADPKAGVRPVADASALPEASVADAQVAGLAALALAFALAVTRVSIRRPRPPAGPSPDHTAPLGQAGPAGSGE